MNAEELRRDRVNHPDKYKKRNIQITFKPSGPDRWQEYHDGTPVGVVTEIPRNARPVDPEAEAETRRLRKLEDAHGKYQKRKDSDPRFGDILQKIREKAGTDPDLLETLDTDPSALNRAYDSIRRGEVEARHQARLAGIKERQHSSNAMQRDQADLDMMAEIEWHREAVGKIAAGDHAGLDPDDGEGEE